MDRRIEGDLCDDVDTDILAGAKRIEQRDIGLSGIAVSPDRMRVLRPEVVKELTNSMRKQGLLQRAVAGDDVSAKDHRYEATGIDARPTCKDSAQTGAATRSKRQKQMRNLREAWCKADDETLRGFLRGMNLQRVSAEPPRGKDAVRRRVYDAVSILSGLPPATEVVGYFDGDDAALLVCERLGQARAWFLTFAFEMEKRDPRRSRSSSVDEEASAK